ncbi:protein MMS22-like isoform X2 [Pomacea canaliculata]|nr:protein MMS22-like isoform X2 [Pomacea canaliculata]XP_025098840.1 protein MMS22-like isoform X2 [Pomacea canaliculata]
MTDSTYSMTPPVSPYQYGMDLEITETETSASVKTGNNSFLLVEAAYFCCGGEAYPGREPHLYEHFSFHKNGVIKSGALDRLMPPQPNQEGFEPSLTLFGFTFFYLALEEEEERDRLFMLARQAIRDVRNVNDQDSAKKVSKRQELIKFLLYVKDFIKRFLPENGSSRWHIVRQLVRKLHLLLHIGKLSDQPSECSLIQQASIHHIFHQHLDICWYMLEILHTLTTQAGTADVLDDIRLCQKLGDSKDSGILSSFDQLVQFLLFDLVCLAVPIFEKLHSQEWLHSSPFPCGCVLEMWTLVLRLTTIRKEKYGTESFWVQLHHILQTLWDTCAEPGDGGESQDSNIFMLSISQQPSCPASFCLWLTTHLAHLTCFDNNGLMRDASHNLNNFFIVDMLMEKVLRTSPKEETLRACLRCCASISSLWRPTRSLITTLWEYFSHRLNERFQQQVASVEGLAIFNKTSSALLEKCERLCCGDLDGLAQETSFSLFLRLLTRLLKSSEAEWRQIKGRFYSKFHQRRMQDLTETGLHNLTCLFLVLALCVDPEEVALKLSNLYDMLDPATWRFSLRVRIWCGALAMIEQLVKANHDISVLAEKMAFSFNTLCRQLSEGKLDYTQRQEASGLVAMYLHGVQAIVDHSHLKGAEYLFIGEGIRLTLENGNESEVRNMLTTLDTIAARLRYVTDHLRDEQANERVSHHQHQQDLADRLWQFVFPFVCNHACTLTPPLCLADLAVTLTHLSQTFPPPLFTCPEGTVSIFKQFALGDTVAVSIVCHYLVQVLGEPAIRDFVLSSSQQSSAPSAATQASRSLLQKDVIRAWFRCVMLMSETSSSLQELTQQVLLLPEVISLSAASDIGAHNLLLGSCPATWRTFLKSVGHFFRNAKGLLEKRQARDQVSPYFQDVAQHAAPLLRTLAPASTLLHMFRVVGHLVKYCAPALYLQSKPCPLPTIIKTFLLPLPVYNRDKPLHPSYSAAVKETLHLFIEGLGKMEHNRLPDVQRHLRDIVTNYLFRFPLTLTDLDLHPVLRVIRKLQTQPLAADRINFVNFLSSLVCGLLKSSGNPSHARTLETVSKWSAQSQQQAASVSKPAHTGTLET